MTLSEVKLFIGKPVRIVKHLWDDAYGEEGMYAYIREATDSRYNKGDVHDCWEILLDYGPFRAYNLAREPRAYYPPGADRLKRPLVTATEAGMYPEDHKEKVFLPASDPFTMWFVEGVPVIDDYESQLTTLLIYAEAQGLTLAAAAIKGLLK